MVQEEVALQEDWHNRGTNEVEEKLINSIIFNPTLKMKYLSTCDTFEQMINSNGTLKSIKKPDGTVEQPYSWEDFYDPTTGKSIKAKIEYFMLDAEGEIIEGTYGEKEVHFEEWVNEWSPYPEQSPAHRAVLVMNINRAFRNKDPKFFLRGSTASPTKLRLSVDRIMNYV
jgi:hypothetical protein